MNVSTRVVPVPYMCQNASPARGRFCRFFARPHRYRAEAGGCWPCWPSSTPSGTRQGYG